MLLAVRAVVVQRGTVQERQRVDAGSPCQPFHRPQGEVPFAAFHAAHVGAMHPQLVGEALLAHATDDPQRPQASSDDSLQLAFHPPTVVSRRLSGLQTDK